VSLGANFFEIKERGATQTGAPLDWSWSMGWETECLLATTDAEIGKIGPSPSGCGKVNNSL